MARYSLFVLKVPNPKWGTPSKHTYCWSESSLFRTRYTSRRFSV